MKVQRSTFGATADGRPVDLIALSNSAGTTAKIITFGATLVSLEIPDRNGELANVVLGYDELAGYEGDMSYFGATVGRYANRIAGGTFSLDGRTYQLATNNGENHLHGGSTGFNKRIWTADESVSSRGAQVTFSYISPDGEENYPGQLSAEVTYLLTTENELCLEYVAKSDKPTHCNLTNHSYFNLAGHGAGDILGHQLWLNCDRYLPTDDRIPTGAIASVMGTPLDFTGTKAIGAEIGVDSDEVLYDVCYVLRAARENATVASEVILVGRVSDPTSGRAMEIRTSEPAVQLYTANHLDGTPGACGATYGKHQGFCLETQHFPDTPNQPGFPSTVLRPGAVCRSTTIHKFWAS